MNFGTPELIAGPVAEPITLADAKLQLGFGPMEDSDRAASLILSDKLRSFIVAARRACESYTRRVFVTQRWLLRMYGFPGKDWRYNWNGYPAIPLPVPPLQSIEFVKYVDTFGAVQDLPRDVSYGNSAPQYGYQLWRGSEVDPGCIYSSWARPWPPTRMVPSNVMVQFRCGYGQPIAATIAADSTALTCDMAFNPDDAPLMTGETGLPVSIPGAGVGGLTLNTFIAAVDGSGNATLKDPAKITVTAAAGWAGPAVPEEILSAIKMTVQEYYDKGSDACALPEVAVNLLSYYRNLTA